VVDRAIGAATAVEPRTAFHEAGHAVAVFLLGGEVAYVTAVADLARWGGQCSWIGDCGAFGEATIAFAGPMAEQHAQRTRSLATERTRDIASAGPSATAADDLDGIFGVEGALDRARQRHDRVGTTSDHDVAFDALAEVSGSLEEITAALEFAKVRTRTLVQSPRFQVLVNRLAHVLLERGHLDGEAAMNELRRADEVGGGGGDDDG